MNGKAFIVGAVMLAVGLGSGYYVGQRELEMTSTGSMNVREITLCRGLVRLWSDHVIWTRAYVVAAIAGTPDLQAATDRLMRNQEDLGAAIVPYYGQDAGNKLTALLKEHIAIAVEVVAAAKADDKDAYAAADDKWHANARDIAVFLSSANQNWSQDMLQAMLYDHLKVTTQEVVARLEGNWDADVKAFDDIFSQALVMAHDLAMGIIKQFPGKFQA